jgi:hypothetical protein
VRNRVVITASVLLVAILLALTLGRSATAQKEAPAAKAHFLEVGKNYELDPGPLGRTVKVTEAPRDGLVKCEVPAGDIWINLQLVRAIARAKD